MTKKKIEYEIVKIERRGWWKWMQECWKPYEATVKLANGEEYVFNVSFDSSALTPNEHLEYHLKEAIKTRHPGGLEGLKRTGKVEASK